MASLFKKRLKLELLTNSNMLMMVGNGIRSGICYTIHKHTKVNNKYIENYDKNIASSYLRHLCTKNLYGWSMSQTLSVNGFKWKLYI